LKNNYGHNPIYRIFGRICDCRFPHAAGFQVLENKIHDRYILTLEYNFNFWLIIIVHLWSWDKTNADYSDEYDRNTFSDIASCC